MSDHLEPGEKAATPAVLVVRESDMRRCPKQSMLASHYYRDHRGDVHCLCTAEEQHAKRVIR